MNKEQAEAIVHAQICTEFWAHFRNCREGCSGTIQYDLDDPDYDPKPLVSACESGRAILDRLRAKV